MKIKNIVSYVFYLLLICLMGEGIWVGEAHSFEGQPYFCEDDLIEIMFVRDSKVRLRGDSPADLRGNATAGIDAVLQEVGPCSWSRICDVPEERIDEISARGEARTGKLAYNPNNMYHVRIAKGHDIWEVCRELEDLPGVMRAMPIPKPMPLPSYPPDYTLDTQAYLRPAANTPTGVDADYAWTQPGGDGSGVIICDIEYSWNLMHNDLQNPYIGSYTLYYSDPYNDDNHGTAVLGILSSLNNGWGTTGICYGAYPRIAGSYYYQVTPPAYWNVPGAIVSAASNMNPGDVILLEHQWDYTGSNGFVPIEWWGDTSPSSQSNNGVYESIEWAILYNDIIVIEAGGNGGIDLDNLTWYGNSGAIIVGAGGAYPGGTPPDYYPEDDLERNSFSCYGSWIDVQGWGENVVTTGYNYLYSTEGKDYWYTDRFSGTSSASAIVAGVVASASGYWKANISASKHLIGEYVRNAMVATGTPQVTPPSGHIGPRPNLQAMFAEFDKWVDRTTSMLNYPQNPITASWTDYDNDNDPDIYLTCFPYQTNRLYRNDGGGNFTDVTAAPIDDPGYGGETAWGDYDNDGDLDFYLINHSATYSKLFRYEGSDTFVDATQTGVGTYGGGGNCAWGDYDNDGDIDLLIGRTSNQNRLLRNDNDGDTLVEVTPLVLADFQGQCVSWVDYDNDGDLDVYMSDDVDSSRLVRNDGGGNFVDVTAAPIHNKGRINIWGDYDNDGDLDVYLMQYRDSCRLIRNDGGGNFTDVTSPIIGDTGRCVYANWIDYDNDGDLDLYLAREDSPNSLFRNDGGGTFTEDTHGLLMELGATFSSDWADYDSDGDIDVFLANEYVDNGLFNNRATSGKHWLHVKLVGLTSNKSGIGAHITVHTGSTKQMRMISGNSHQNHLVAYFGLGSLTSVDSVVVNWPSGAAQVVTWSRSPVDTLIEVTEETTVICGDANGDLAVNVGDAVFLIGYIFKGGPAPDPLCVGDANGDDDTNVGDAVYLIAYVFKGGPAPVADCCP